MIEFDRYINWCGLSLEDSLELLPKFDLLTEDALIYINSIIPYNILDNIDFNITLLNIFKSTFWIKTKPNFFIEKSGKYFNWKYSENKVEYFCIGKIIDGTVLPYIERRINDII